MKKLKLALMSLLMLSMVVAHAQGQPAAEVNAQAAAISTAYQYETVPGDPLKARIYTLENGLKVYMTVNKLEPRIQTYVAVRAGSKNDPSETTGLAHYFEHMMFKGSKHFGTKNYEEESKLIKEIENLFEVYRTIPMDKDAERRAMYAKIDSVSALAAKYAIANEYDKLMSTIGASGTNAYTSLDQTVYVENIPSNQLENWAKIQSDRFEFPVLRLFHSELETIYEEKNMTMTKDPRKVFTAMLEGLFPAHKYGTQTTIGTQLHLKNPSMTNINKFHSEYYVPNNMAVCISGDFNPDEAIKVIDQYFGKMKAGNVPAYTYPQEKPFTAPVVKEVFGPSAENISLAYRFGGANSNDVDKLIMLDMILTNGKVGLIDLNLNQAQKVLSAGSSPMILADYSALQLRGKPKAGQTLDQVKDLLLAQVEKVKKGEFPEWLMDAIVNDLELNEIKQYEDNNSRANAFVDAFVNGVEWKKSVGQLERLRKITKEEIVEFANKHLGENYVVVYKRKGKDKSYIKMKKNRMTPIKIDRDSQSDFLKEIQSSEVENIKPVFSDYKKELSFLKAKNDIEIIYKENELNETFSMYYLTEMGRYHNPKLSLAINYLEYLGTENYTAEQFKEELYKLGISFRVMASTEQVYVSLSGLSKNMEKGMQLFEGLLANPKANEEALENMKQDIFKNRADGKANPQSHFGRLVEYATYGKDRPSMNVLSEKEINAITSTELIDIIKGLNSYKHRVIYYGPEAKNKVVETINKNHKTPATLLDIPAGKEYTMLPTEKNIVYVVDNPSAKQATLLFLTRGDLYDASRIPTMSLFNQYFGGGMNSIVFQELRESRALAYTAVAFYQAPGKKKEHFKTLGYIATQHDKLGQALEGMIDLMENMPEAQSAFDIAKAAYLEQMNTARTTKQDVIFAYLAAQELGLDYDINKVIYEKLQGMTMEDIKAFQQKYVKGTNKVIIIQGNIKDLDMKTMKKYGKVKKIKADKLYPY